METHALTAWVSIYNQEAGLKNPTPVSIGRLTEHNLGKNFAFNYDIFLAHRDEILAMKETTHTLWLMLKAEKGA